jgi:hypothetical protein
MKKIRHLLDSGVEAVVTPLSAFTIKALRDRANTLHPDPDPAADKYKVELPENVIGDVRGEETLEWQEDRRDAVLARSEWLTFAVIELAVDFGDKDALVAQFADEREHLARFIDMPVDALDATLRHCVLRSPTEPAFLFNVAAGQVALSEDEVAEGVRYFRPDVARR